MGSGDIHLSYPYNYLCHILQLNVLQVKGTISGKNYWSFIMKILCIACDAITRPVYLSAAVSPHIVDIILIERGLHNQPEELRETLQKKIDNADSSTYDAITLVYGLCGQATKGLQARNIPLVIPRAHDCITLFLGSRERYQDHFENNPGTYWYSHDYIERDDGSGGVLSLGSNMESDSLDDEYLSYVEKYGEDNAEYLMTIMGAWKKHYQRAAFIDLGIGDSSLVKSRAQSQASERGWMYEEITGNILLIKNLLSGSWENNQDTDFLIVPPEHSIEMTFDEAIIGCKLVNRQ
jgi:hypothetical protein